MGPKLFPLHYWRGVTEALEAIGCDVIVTKVPRAADVAVRAEHLKKMLESKLVKGASVNLVGHSMGGLDCRYMISRLLPRKPEDGDAYFSVKSLTTISTPHRGSSVASFADLAVLMEPIYNMLASSTSLDFRAFTQLTPEYALETFNPSTPNHPDVAYYSYGADAEEEMKGWAKYVYPFYWTWKYLKAVEGPNDGLVSVESAKWGEYQRTLMADHVDLINLMNTWRWESVIKASEVKDKVKDAAAKAATQDPFSRDDAKEKAEKEMKKDVEEKTFNAIKLYLEIATMLAEKGF
ncbi:hypothetical protein HK104_003213 [Borealophlyctis nickersoniae]|nr:hypothetical protein HK104_003213 [Borealophlyctis nickersoniae]